MKANRDCSGRLTSIRRRAKPDRAARCASRRRRASWGWPRICTSPRPAGFWCKAQQLDRAQVERLASELIADLVVETPVVAEIGDAQLVGSAAAVRRKVNGDRTA